jgi:hypothetical protein
MKHQYTAKYGFCYLLSSEDEEAELKKVHELACLSCLTLAKDKLQEARGPQMSKIYTYVFGFHILYHRILLKVSTKD